MRILIAEDDAETAGFVAQGLRELAHIVTLVADGHDALRIGLEDEHDVLVLDQMLPGCDGLTVLRALRTSKVIAPVILLIWPISQIGPSNQNQLRSDDGT